MNKSKSTAVRELEAGIQSIFDAKQKAAVRDAFDKFIPFGAKSPQLRKSLSQLEEEKGIPADERATRSMVELSNVIQPFLYHLSDEQYQDLNEKFANTLNHIVRLESSIVNPPPPPKVESAPLPPPPPLELEVILSNNDVLRKHIDTIEAQIAFVKESKRKLMETNQANVAQLEKQNAQLRVQLQHTKQECEQYHQQYLQKEKELQMALVQLSGAQEELKRVKLEYNEKALNKNASMESFQRNSKYSAKEFVKLNATIDAMRLELTKERLDRSHERETLKSALTSAENKLNFSEVIINELRDQLQSIGASQYQETAEFKNSVLNSSISFQPQNLDIDYLHASTSTAASLNVTQNSSSSSRPQFQHPYVPSVLRHGISKNPLVQSPVHTLPRGANYMVVENSSPLKSYRYKSPFVVKNVDNSVAGTPPVYAGQSAKKRSQSASALRQVAYAPIATTPVRGNNNRSNSVGRTGIRSLRGVSKEALRSLSTEEPVPTQSLPHHLVETSTSIPADQMLSSGESIADKIGLATWNHPMYRSLQAKGFTAIAAPVASASTEIDSNCDAESLPHTDDGHPAAAAVGGSISGILATTVDQHSVDESESSAVERVEYITDDMLASEQFLQNNAREEQEEAENHSPEEHEDLKRMPLTPQRMSHSNSFTGSGGKTDSSAPQRNLSRAASLSQMHNASTSPLDLTKYKNSASSPIKSVEAKDQASSPIPHSEKTHLTVATSPVPADYSAELSRMTPSPQKRLPHTQSFSHAATSPHMNHSPLTLDKRSSSLSRVTGTQYDPSLLQKHASTSPIHVAPPKGVQTHEQGTVTSPIQHQYAEDLRNMSESPGKLSRSTSFRGQQSSGNLKAPLSSDKRSASMNHKPSEAFDPAKYKQLQQSAVDVQTIEDETHDYSDALKNMSESPGKLSRSISFRDQQSTSNLKAPLSSDKRSSSMNHKPSQAFDLAQYKQLQQVQEAPTSNEEEAHHYSDALKNMSESPSGLNRSQSFNAKSQSAGQLTHDKRSASLSRMAGVTRIDSAIHAAASANSSARAKPPTPSGLSATMSYATFSIQEVEEEGDSSDEGEGNNNRDNDDLSTITPVVVGDDAPTPNLMPAAATAASATRHHDEQLLKSLYEEIQHLKLTHLSPPRVSSNRSLPKMSPFMDHHDGHQQQQLEDLNLSSIHVENLHAIQATLQQPQHQDNSHHTAKYDSLIREYNELLSLYVHEMKKTRRMQIDFRNEIHDSTRSVSEFEELMSILKSENQQLQKQVDDLQSVVVQNVSQHNQHIADVEHKYVELEKELLNVEETLRSKEREVVTLQLTNQAAASAQQNRSSLTNHVESCLVQLKAHSNEREITKIVELLKKELHSLYASQDHTHTSGGLRHTSSFRSVKAHESVSDLKVDVTIEALKNLLHWFDHQLDANTAEIHRKENVIHDQNKLIDSKEQLLLDCRHRISELERLRSAPPPAPPAALSAAESQILSLKNQLEHTYQELEEAKKRHNGGAPILNITSSGLHPRGSQSPVRGGSSRNLHQEHESLAAAYSSRHSPTRARQQQHQQTRGDRLGDSGFVSQLEESNYHHHDHQYAASTAQPTTNSSRFRDSLMDGSMAVGVEPFSPNAESHLLRRSLDSNMNQSQHIQNSVVVKELEKRALAAEMKCELLSNQIKNMPASLSVANAEKRVMECKLKKATLNFEVTIKQMEADALHKIGEFKTFLQLERTEKEALQSKIKDQAATIHQLTHHLKIIHASKAPPEVSANSASFLYNEGTIKVQVPPAPWENGLDSQAGSIVEPGGLSLNASQHLMHQHQQHQHSLRTSMQSSRQREPGMYNTMDFNASQSSQLGRGVSPQRGRRI